jgi:hypothetical protein
MLQAHQKAQHEERELRGEAWKDHGLALPSNDGYTTMRRVSAEH